MVRKRRERNLTASLPECFHNGIILIVICSNLYGKDTEKNITNQTIEVKNLPNNLSSG